MNLLESNFNHVTLTKDGGIIGKRNFSTSSLTISTKENYLSFDTVDTVKRVASTKGSSNKYDFSFCT
jgi:hypothetical protein